MIGNKKLSSSLWRPKTFYRTRRQSIAGQSWNHPTAWSIQTRAGHAKIVATTGGAPFLPTKAPCLSVSMFQTYFPEVFFYSKYMRNFVLSVKKIFEAAEVKLLEDWLQFWGLQVGSGRSFLQHLLDLTLKRISSQRFRSVLL